MYVNAQQISLSPCHHQTHVVCISMQNALSYCIHTHTESEKKSRCTVGTTFSISAHS
ncbi:hypothetical protein BDB00DRAFT_797032 [Zychaea mexicana]|uniref:uncharacterized protein n=1 Tax=Zychaea mexicana TaxID=64656 RepID=UPI0022FEAF64|nr:uncharacterized protein BDB00DRAFT_797032 [Zychaea mexicana]KAI9498871.1 hypothetical protein BDB00DRAFT_797032 [Zychaea mexicana]